MVKWHCDICRRKLQQDDMGIHHIVPEEIIKQAVLPDSRTVRLCLNCRNAVNAWYNERVSNCTYDWMTKRFVPKSVIEMVKEYEAAYDAFIKYRRLL